MGFWDVGLIMSCCVLGVKYNASLGKKFCSLRFSSQPSPRLSGPLIPVGLWVETNGPTQLNGSDDTVTSVKERHCEQNDTTSLESKKGPTKDLRIWWWWWGVIWKARGVGMELLSHSHLSVCLLIILEREREREMWVSPNPKDDILSQGGRHLPPSHLNIYISFWEGKKVNKL